MSLQCKVGNFAMPIGAAGSTLAITGVGFQPVCVLFIMNGLTASADGASTAAPSHLAFGIAISTTNRRFYSTYSNDNVTPSSSATGHRADGCIGVVADGSPAWDGWMDLSSLDADGFTIKVGQQLSSGNAYRVQYLAIGGNELTNVTSGTFTKSTSAGSQGITGVGFKPDAVIILGGHPLLTNALPDLQNGNVFGFGAGSFQATQQQAVMGGTDRHGVATSQCRHTQALGSITMEWVSTLDTLANNGQLVSMDADGFTLNFSATGSGLVYDYIAFKGGLYNVAELVTASDTTIVKQSTGFVPVGGFQFSSQQPDDNFTLLVNDLLSIGCFDGILNQGSVNASQINAKNPTSVVTGSSFANIVAYVAPTGGFAQRTAITVLTPGLGTFSYKNGNADGDANLFYVLEFGAENSKTGQFTLS